MDEKKVTTHKCDCHERIIVSTHEDNRSSGGESSYGVKSQEDDVERRLATRTHPVSEKDAILQELQPTETLQPFLNLDSPSPPNLPGTNHRTSECFHEGDYPRTPPGAVHVPGIYDPSEQLPIASRVTRNGQGTPLNDTRAIIDGIPLPPSSPRKKNWLLDARLFYIALFCTIASLASVIVPAQSRWQAQLYRIIVPISGRKILNDKSTVQHFVWMDMAKKIPLIDNFSEYKKKKDKIIERYATFVVALAVSADYEWDREEPYADVCDALMCNEDEEVSVMVLRNLRHTKWGGGIVATEVGLLTGLTDLIFARDRLIATIPTEIGRLKDLRNLDLRNNFIFGTIPTEIGLMENLEWIFLDDNMLTGTIPTEIGNLKNLIFANFSHNSLSGILPPQVANLVDLGGIALQHTNVSGSLQPFCKLNFSNDDFVLRKQLTLIELNYKYTYSGRLGLYSDCQDGVPIVECDCCLCDD